MTDNFCGQCGTANDGGRFCRNCGAPLAEAAPAAPPAPAAPVAPSAPVVPPAPTEPLVNPFANVVLTDLVRDVAALVLLFGSLALPWDAAHDASDRWWVVLATIISALSLAAPYVSSLEVVPGWTGAQSRLVKQVCVVPYLVSVVAAVVNELVHVQHLEGGVGAAVGVGLVGALLAVGDRASDEEATGVHDGLWRSAAVALLGAGITVFGITTVVFTVSHLDDFNGQSFGGYHPALALVASALLGLAGYVVAVGLPALGFLAGSREWTRTLATAGFVLVAVQFFCGASDAPDPLFGGLRMEFVKGYFGIFLILGGVALVAARPVQRRLTEQDPVGTWVRTAQAACLVIAVGLVASVVARFLALIADDGVKADLVIQIVLTMVAAGAGVVARMVLESNADKGRKVVVAITGAIVIVGIVALSVGRAADSLLLGKVSISPAEAIGWFGMPALVLWSLLVPKAVRDAFGPLATPAAPAPYQPPAPPQQP